MTFPTETIVAAAALWLFVLMIAGLLVSIGREGEPIGFRPVHRRDVGDWLVPVLCGVVWFAPVLVLALVSVIKG